jgi:hypothetical protein
VDFEATGQILIIDSALVKYLKKLEYTESVHSSLYIGRKSMIQLGERSFMIFSLSLISL